MTVDDRFVRSLTDWLDGQVGLGTPGYLDDVLIRTRQTRQRHWWSSLERWLPMDTTLRLAPLPKLSLLLVVIGLLVALAAIVVVVGSQTRLPAPFGPAENGNVLYGTEGDIYVLTPDGGHKAIVSGPTNDFAPYFALDGSKFAFLRATGGPGRTALMLANVDGSNVRPLTDSLEDLSDAVWSPTGSHIALASRIDKELSVWTLDVVTGSQKILVSGMRAESLVWTPDSRELIFRGETVGRAPLTYGLYRVGADGSGLHAILPPTDNGEHWQNPALSPDGTRIIYTQWDPHIGGRLWVVDMDGQHQQMLRFDAARNSQSDFFAEWSPDGTKIVFNRGTAQVTYHLAVGSVGGGAVVDIGPELAWDAAAIAAFSPDGSKVIARYSNGETWIFDVDGGPGQRIDVSTSYLMSWQRVAH